jgi:hypothetical protein
MPCPKHAWTREQAKKSNYPIILTVILSIPAVFIAAFQQSPYLLLLVLCMWLASYDA